MNCPQCGERSRVTNSRTADSSEAYNRNMKLVSTIADFVGWYTADWVARQRVCDCGWSAMTVELSIEDLSTGWEPQINRSNARAFNPVQLDLTHRVFGG